MDVFLEDIDVPSLLEEVSAIIAPLAGKSGNALEIHTSEALGSLRSDRTKVKQCLLNVLSNANKFTSGGKLSLHVERFERSMIRIAISDTGIGMNEEQLGRLFQAFSQADPSTTKRFGGTGLGLALTRPFGHLLGGEITVASQPGVGSTFTIVLPDSAVAPATVRPADVPQISGDA